MNYVSLFGQLYNLMPALKATLKQRQKSKPSIKISVGFRDSDEQRIKAIRISEKQWKPISIPLATSTCCQKSVLRLFSPSLVR